MSLNFVQDQIFDENSALFVGQLADFSSGLLSRRPSYVNEEDVFVGRGVVKGAVFDASVHHVRTPFAVKAATGATVLADFVGIVIRGYSKSTDQSSGEQFQKADGMVALAEPGENVIIAVKANAEITHDDSVYMSIDAAQAPMLPVGEFTNAAGAGVIAITSAKFYGSTVIGDVARIKL